MSEEEALAEELRGVMYFSDRRTVKGYSLLALARHVLKREREARAAAWDEGLAAAEGVVKSAVRLFDATAHTSLRNSPEASALLADLAKWEQGT